MRHYHPFMIKVESLQDGVYLVAAQFQGASWTGAIPGDLPLLQPAEVQQALLWLERGFIDRDYAQDFGARLFQTLFAGDILEGFRAACAHAAPDDGVRIVLTLPPELAGLPWELMYDRSGEHGFLARSATAPLARHIEGAPLPHRPPDEGPLRVLVIIASPRDLAPVSGSEETKTLSAILEPRGAGLRETLHLLGQTVRRPETLPELLPRLQRRRLFALDLLPNATRQRIQAKLIESRNANRPYHAIHFIGHGQSGPQGSFVLLESEDGKADAVPAADFAELIDEPAINLLVLNACQTAAAATLFDGVAQATLRRGIPAVIGMQVPIVDRTAVAFAREFYAAWAAGEPIESALAYARRLFSAGGAGAAADWGIPVLYMGPVEGLRLELDQPRPRWPWPFIAVRWIVTGTIALLTLLSLLLLDLPGIVQAARTQVPIIRCHYPSPMNAGFNVAVAEFGRLEAGSPPKSYDLAVQHTNELKSQLTNELNALLQDLGGESVAFQVESYCMIEGATEREQTEAAAWLADATNADLVVYGYLVGPGEGSGVQIHFYSNKPDWTWSELFDGTWLAASERINCTDGCVSLALGNRIKALSRLTAAMTYFFAAVPCREYLNPIASCRANLDQALRVLNEEDVTNDDERVLSHWTGRGKEVVHLFRGGIYLERAIRHSLDPRLASGDREQMLAAWEPALENFEAARAEFEQATEINPLYSRAYIGLALTDYNQGYLGPRANFQLIERAIAQYDQLLAPPDEQTAAFEKPEGAFVDLKLYHNRAMAYYSKFFLLGDEAAAQQAQADLEVVTREFVTLAAAQATENVNLLCAWTGRFCTTPPDLPRAVREMAARSYYFLGALHQHAGRTPAAIDAYSQSIALTSDPETAAVARYALGRLYENTGEPAQAQAQYVQLCQALRTWDGIQGWQEPAIARLVALGASDAKEECT